MILVTGATGYVGSQLVDELLERGETVRTLSRRGAGKGDARKGDVLSGAGLPEALEGVDTAYTSSTRWARGGDFAAKDRQAAANFAEAAANAGVRRVVYLGGLGSEDSEHLRSRHEVANMLRARLQSKLVYVRAAMIIGPGSASYDILEHLVKRLPVMIVPKWLDTKTQPIALADVDQDARGPGDRSRTRRTRCSSAAPTCSTYREMMAPRRSADGAPTSARHPRPRAHARACRPTGSPSSTPVTSG